MLKMEKNEPLKGKILLWNGTTGDIETTDGKYFLETKAENGKYVEILLKSDIISAVEGFVNDLEAEKVAIFPDIDGDGYEVLYDEEGDFIRFETVIKLLKKWFADVFEEVKESKLPSI